MCGCVRGTRVSEGQFQGSQAPHMGLDRQCGLRIRKVVSPGRRAWTQPVLRQGPGVGVGVGGWLGGEVAAGRAWPEHPSVYLVHIMLI